MINSLLQYALRFVLVLLVQVLVLNNLQLSGFINPYFYIWFILVLPFNTPGWVLLLSAFFLGLGIDIFPQGLAGNGATLGTHAAASVAIAFLRPTVLRWINPREEYRQDTLPDARSYGLSWFAGYVLIMAAIHHFILFFLEDLSLRDLFRTLWRVFLSSFFSFILIMIWELTRIRLKK
ncbi:MAG: hypothetical protein PHN30_07115 [Bacteroidales bacterium]|jgi:hypothetical protein|nr:hypothetical protein [Bacteroidales bacterium]MDD3385469.1 hypothetical protein [Bacteroidales bacterium]MDD3812983.1 hypothetical protein [Bacteroidales bacterium]MDD4813330.1 hypothetical protein [Bacteroidales bacterium]